MLSGSTIIIPCTVQTSQRAISNNAEALDALQATVEDLQAQIVSATRELTACEKERDDLVSENASLVRSARKTVEDYDVMKRSAGVGGALIKCGTYVMFIIATALMVHQLYRSGSA